MTIADKIKLSMWFWHSRQVFIDQGARQKEDGQ
jgi:hypothetical protein